MLRFHRQAETEGLKFRPGEYSPTAPGWATVVSAPAVGFDEAAGPALRPRLPQDLFQMT